MLSTPDISFNDYNLEEYLQKQNLFIPMGFEYFGISKLNLLIFLFLYLKQTFSISQHVHRKEV